MNVAVIGLGYVGIVHAAVLANHGHIVLCVDSDAEKLEMLRHGRCGFYEPKLDDLLHQEVEQGRIVAVGSIVEAVSRAELSFICVGTPEREDGVDLSAVRAVAAEIGRGLRETGTYHVCVVKSTVPPGTTRDLVIPAVARSSGLTPGSGFGACMNPEFLREGCALDDAIAPDRIVIGQLDERSGATLKSIYKTFDCPVKVMGPTSAEMVKYVCNAFFASLISFANEVAGMCEAVDDVDDRDVSDALFADRRFRRSGGAQADELPGLVQYLYSGLGFGGSCFPKDLVGLRHFAESVGVQPRIVSAVIDVNRNRASLVRQVLEQTFGELAGLRVAVLGLAFKPNSDDTRRSVGIRVAEDLVDAGVGVRVHDPLVDAQRTELAGRVDQATDVEALLRDCSACVICTAWDVYREIPWPELVPPDFLVIDGRRVIADERLRDRVRLWRTGEGFG